MDFSKRKLPKEAAETLRRFSVSIVKPYALMMSPVYVYLRRNLKFLSVKGPLDFFTEKEVDKIRPYEIVFLPPFVDRVLPFAQAGRHVKVLLSWVPKKKGALPPAPFELSDSILKIIGPLWSKGSNEIPHVEPFFVTAFVNELCHPIPGPQMLEVRERDTVLFETGILRSSWAVFLALHLGLNDLEFLDLLRIRVFTETSLNMSGSKGHSEVDQLIRVCNETLQDPFVSQLSSMVLDVRQDRISQKISGRLNRVKNELTKARNLNATIFGEGGFADA
ncbi:MAG: hypothetical protein AABZ55_02830 [Bdellovibrionota bacterium]